MKIIVHYVNGKTWTLKGEGYWYIHTPNEITVFFKDHVTVKREYSNDILAIESHKHGNIYIHRCLPCCVVNTTIVTKKEHDKVKDTLQWLENIVNNYGD